MKSYNYKESNRTAKFILILLALSVFYSCAAIEEQRRSKELVAYMNAAEEAYETVSEIDTIDAYKWFITEYPDALLPVNKAKERLAVLEQSGNQSSSNKQDELTTMSSYTSNQAEVSSNDKEPALTNKTNRISAALSESKIDDVIAALLKSAKYNYENGYYYKASQTIKASSSLDLSDDISSEVQNLSDKIDGLKQSDPNVATMFKDKEYHLAKYWDGTYCYVDNAGEVVLKGNFEYARPFSEGLALVTLKDKSVFIDYDGNIVIDLPKEGQTEYTILGSFHDGLARCQIKDSSRSLNGDCYIDKLGNERMTFLAMKDSAQTYDQILDFSEGYAVIQYGFDRLKGYIDTEGQWLIEPMYKDAKSFQDGMAKILYPNKEKWGYIDTSGEVKIIPRYRDEWSGNFSEGLALVVTPELGYINKEGKLVIDLMPFTVGEYNYFGVAEANGFSGGIAAVSIGYYAYESRLLFVDNQGNEIFRFDNTDQVNAGQRNENTYVGWTPFSEGYACIYDKWNGWGIINLEGEFIYEPKRWWAVYDNFEDGLAPIEFTDAKGYINYMGEVVYAEE